MQSNRGDSLDPSIHPTYLQGLVSPQMQHPLSWSILTAFEGFQARVQATKPQVSTKSHSHYDQLTSFMNATTSFRRVF